MDSIAPVYMVDSRANQDTRESSPYLILYDNYKYRFA